MSTTTKEPKQCAETVYVRDMLRYSGRGRGGFSMHYTRKQCGRYVKTTDTHCWQHRAAPADQAPSGGEA